MEELLAAPEGVKRQVSDKGGQWYASWKLTWPARVRSSDLVRSSVGSGSHDPVGGYLTTSKPVSPLAERGWRPSVATEPIHTAH